MSVALMNVNLLWLTMEGRGNPLRLESVSAAPCARRKSGTPHQWWRKPATDSHLEGGS